MRGDIAATANISEGAAARNGRNPGTGEAILIPAATVPRFKASKAGNVGAKFSAGSSLKVALRVVAT